MAEPTELVSCGKCGTVNRVPYGLEQFQCHSCGALVSVARAPSASCAAASPSAQYFDGLREPPASTSTPSASSSSSAAAAPEPRRGASGPLTPGGFFGKLQRKMEKVVRTLESGLDPSAPTSASQPSNAKAGSAAGPGPRANARTGQAFEPAQRKPPAEAFVGEAEQLQWALSASLAGHARESEQQVEEERWLAAAPASTDTAASAAASQHVQAAATQAAQSMHAAEERVKRAEEALSEARANERAAAAERAGLQRQLEDSECLARDLTEQLDMVDGKLSKQLARCEALERVLAVLQLTDTAARAAEPSSAPAAEAESEAQRAAITRLLARIRELQGAPLEVPCATSKDWAPTAASATLQTGETEETETGLPSANANAASAERAPEHDHDGEGAPGPETGTARAADAAAD